MKKNNSFSGRRVEARPLQKSKFWKLHKFPERLYGEVLPSVLGWLYTCYFNKCNGVSRRDLSSCSLRINGIFKCRGQEEGIRYVKACRLAVMKYLEGTPLSRQHAKTLGITLNSDRLPMILGTSLTQAVVDGHTENIRLVMTILTATRALRLGTVPDVSPIEEPRKSIGCQGFDALVSDMEKHAKQFWEDLGYQARRRNRLELLPKRLKFTSYHFTTNGGPNGHALMRSLLGLYALPQNVVDAIKLLGGSVMRERVDLLLRCRDVLWSLLPEFFVSPKAQRRGFVTTREVTHFPDKEYKVRVIAMGDYFSQTALRPLHKYLYQVLKRIPQDCTFDQTAFKTKLRVQEKGDIFVSADLSAATDRFPISVIAMVLRGRLPKWFVDAWEVIMVAEPFWVQSLQRFVRYSVGNPMGFYSSWASFALAHHFVIYWCCNNIGMPWKSAPYALLGDDLVIRHEKLADEYIRVMGILGVEVSEIKSHRSPHFFEFAKRLFYKGVEVSPFPISALQQTANKFYLIVSVLWELERKGAWVSQCGIPEAVSGWFNHVLHWKAKSLVTVKDRAWGTLCIIEVMHNLRDGGVFMTEYAKSLGLHFGGRVINNTVAHNILSNIAVEMFSESMPGSDNFKKASSVPLGDLATSWVMRVTSLFDHPDPMVASSCMDLVTAIPQIQAYGLIEEQYMSLLRTAKRIDTVEGGRWPEILRTLALPLDDRIFVERKSRLITKGSMLISSRLKPRLEMIAAYPQLLDF